MSDKQTCKKCKKEMRFEFSIADEIWNKLPKIWQNRVLCIECFLEELESEVPKQKICLTDFCFLGIVGNLDNREFGGTFIDNDNGGKKRIYFE